LAYDAPTQTISIDLAGYATESWVNSQGFQTSPFNGGYVNSPIYLFYGSPQDTFGLTLASDSISITGESTMYGNSGAGISLGGFGASLAQFPNFPSVALVPGSGLTVTENGITTVVNNGIFSYNNEEPYARKDGVTFDGKVNFTSVSGAAGLNVGIGGVSGTATTPGDLWIASGGVNLNYRDATGAWRICAITTSTNTFSSPQIIDTTATTPGLRITQKGTGNALIVEDSTTPDTSALVVDQNGNVGIGVATGYAATSKVEVVGNVKATTLSTGSGPEFSVNSTAAHTGGSATLDAIVTIGGVNYRISLRPA
jgi:hypothetical protein